MAEATREERIAAAQEKLSRAIELGYTDLLFAAQAELKSAQALPKPAYGQDEARGILAVNPYVEGSGEWHAWGLGFEYAEQTGGVYESPLSGEWADMVSLSELYRRIGVALGGLEIEDDDTEWVAEAFENGYAAYRAGWRLSH